MYKDYLIAGLRVRMKTFGRTLKQAEPYLTENTGEPDIVIKSNPEKLMAAQPHLQLDSCEYLSTGSSFYTQLISFDGILLHSSAVIYGGYAYLFTAPCGTGKSTHTKMWIEAFGKENAAILNDDKPAIRKEDGIWYAYGTPWSGKTDKSINTRAPIGGICVISRGDENIIEPYSGSGAVYSVLGQTARPQSSSARIKILDLIDDLMDNVPIWKMKCTPTVEAAITAQKVMAEKV